MGAKNRAKSGRGKRQIVNRSRSRRNKCSRNSGRLANAFNNDWATYRLQAVGVAAGDSGGGGGCSDGGGGGSDGAVFGGGGGGGRGGCGGGGGGGVACTLRVCVR